MNNSPSRETLYEIFKKARSIEDAESILEESSIRFLISEEISQSEIDVVKSSIDSAQKQVKQGADFIKSLSGADIDVAKLSSITDHLNDLNYALDMASKSLAGVAFKSGSISTFMGKKLTLPQIAQAAIALQRKASGFYTGLTRAIDNITSNLGPLAKEEGPNKTPLKDLLAQNPSMPSPEEIEKGITKAITKAMGGDMMSKIASFFGKSFERGATKEIMQTIPPFDAKAAASEFSSALMSASLSSFTKLSAPPAPESTPSGVESVASKAQEAGEAEIKAGTVDDAGNPTDKAVDGEKGSGSGEEPPAPEDKAAEEQKAAETEIKSAVQDASKAKVPPKAAAFKAMDDWAVSLSASAQKDLKAKNRMGDLKSAVGMALDDAAKAVESEVGAAVQAWRDQHEEQLIRNKRFSKKSFDSLQSMIPKLAAFMMKAKNESSRNIDNRMIKKFVYRQLDKMFLHPGKNIISESQHKYRENDMILYRMNKLAGLRNE